MMDPLARAIEYCERSALELRHRLGNGVHGTVFAVAQQTDAALFALKTHEREHHYRRERNVYLRLREHGVEHLHGCDIPELLDYDDDLCLLLLTIVQPPFVLDFAGAYLDTLPDYSDEVLAEWEAERREQFGARWSDVLAIQRQLEYHGIYLVDIHPGNIRFEN